MDNTTATDIDIAYPEAGDLRLVIGVGACRLILSPGEHERWVTGTYSAPSGTQAPTVVQEGGTAKIAQERSPAAFLSLLSGVPKLSLALGKVRPYTLSLKIGASEVNSDLGGLPISRLVAELG
ncbi:MAG: hypothetical protein Q8P59_01590, partial [Dehalococcoidia bacterium]|nr:hypothetical protein [Dehalococcoidia bacterium]